MGCCGSSSVCACEPMGDLLPKIVYPSDVRAEKQRINAEMLATNAGVLTCVALDPKERLAWFAFYSEWLVFLGEDDAALWVFGSANRYDRALQYERELAAWQIKLRAVCNIPGPEVKPPADNFNPADLMTVVRYGGIAIGVLGAVYLASLAVPFIAPLARRAGSK